MTGKLDSGEIEQKRQAGMALPFCDIKINILIDQTIISIDRDSKGEYRRANVA